MHYRLFEPGSGLAATAIIRTHRRWGLALRAAGGIRDSDVKLFVVSPPRSHLGASVGESGRTGLPISSCG